MKFNVSGCVTVSCYTVVEAKSEAEALEIANKRSLADFHIDNSYDVEECFMFDNDGTPYDLKVD